MFRKKLVKKVKSKLELKSDLHEIFEKFPILLSSKILKEKDSLTISLEKLSPAQQIEFDKLIIPLIIGYAAACTESNKSIKISGGDSLEREYVNTLFTLIEQIKQSYDEAFTKGATTGALSSWKNGLPPELGELTGSFLNRYSAPATISKFADKIAKEYKSEKIEEMKITMQREINQRNLN